MGDGGAPTYKEEGEATTLAILGASLQNYAWWFVGEGGLILQCNYILIILNRIHPITFIEEH